MIYRPVGLEDSLQGVSRRATGAGWHSPLLPPRHRQLQRADGRCLRGDLGLFTSRDAFGEDLTELFNLLTGYTRPQTFHHLLLAPDHLRDGLVMRIRREVTTRGRGGRRASSRR